MQCGSQLEPGSQAYQAKYAHAYSKIDEVTPIDLICAMVKSLREMRRNGVVKNRVSGQDRHQVFDPAPKSHAQEFSGHNRSNSRLEISILRPSRDGIKVNWSRHVRLLLAT